MELGTRRAIHKSYSQHLRDTAVEPPRSRPQSSLLSAGHTGWLRQPQFCPYWAYRPKWPVWDGKIQGAAGAQRGVPDHLGGQGGLPRGGNIEW